MQLHFSKYILLGSIRTHAPQFTMGGCPFLRGWLTVRLRVRQLRAVCLGSYERSGGLLDPRRTLSGNPQLLSNPLQLQPLDILPLIVNLVAALTSYSSVIKWLNFQLLTALRPSAILSNNSATIHLLFI